jgi:predicted permease
MQFERWFYTLPLRIRSLFRRSQTDQELRDELQDHLDQQIKDNLAEGMTDEEARCSALRRMGGMAQVEEQCRDKRRVSLIQDLLQDLHYGFRQLRRSPGFSLIAILCLTLGTGANAAVFSWIEGIGLRPFPAVAHQERLVVVVATSSASGKIADAVGNPDVSWPDWLDFQKSCTLVDAFIADRITGARLGTGARAETVTGSVVSANYFDALGIRPILGRGFQPGEDSGHNAHPLTVISYWLWKERFRSDPDIVGKTEKLEGVPHTIVGVAPEGFYGTFVGHPMQFWVPASMQELFVPGGYMLQDRAGGWIEGFARLKPGVTIAQAQQEISAIAKRLESAYPETNRGRGIRLLPLWQAPFNQAGNLVPTLEVALAVVFFVLLIACANVSGLLLVRSLARRHEMTVRLSIGARRGRLVKQLLTEGLILSSFAAAGGFLVAYTCRNLVTLFFPLSERVDTNLAGHIDWRVLAFIVGISMISTMLFALVPAIQTSNVDLAGALKTESGTSFGSRGSTRIRSVLVLLQVSLSFVLLVIAALLIKSEQRIRNADPGFSTDNVLLSEVDLISAGYDVPRAKTFQDALIERVRALPGVESAAFSRVRPFSYATYASAPIEVPGYQNAVDEQPTAAYNQVGPDYFRTLGIPLLSGRDFTPADNETTRPIAVVNEKMVEQYWHGESPVGKRFQVNGKWLEVTGVAKLARYSSFGEPPMPFFYVPLRQDFGRDPSLNIRTSRDVGTLAADLAREVRAIDASLTPGEVITMRQNINFTALSSQQVAVSLLSIFGILALLMAGVGLYGVMSYAVSQSKRELGLRMAFGATASDLLHLVLSHGLALVVGGVILGGIAAATGTRLLGNLLYQVSPRDPMAFGSALGIMLLAAVAACLVPAWRAARTDPIRALRE